MGNQRRRDESLEWMNERRRCRRRRRWTQIHKIYIRKRKMVYNKWRQHNICFAARLYSFVRVAATLHGSLVERFSSVLLSSLFFFFWFSYSSSYSSSSFSASFVILMFHFNFIHRSSHWAAWVHVWFCILLRFNFARVWYSTLVSGTQCSMRASLTIGVVASRYLFNVQCPKN